MDIRLASSDDATAIAEIYNHYILNSTATFEEAAIDSSVMQQRMAKIDQDGMPWLVAEAEGAIIGYAYASRWRERAAYRFTAEVTIYLDQQSTTRGLGSALYDALFRSLRQLGFHSAIGVITLPNPASVALHEKFAMTKVGHIREVGFKFNRWLDVGYWQVTWP